MPDLETDVGLVDDSLVPEGEDTGGTPGHTPETEQIVEPDIDALLTQLESVRDKIPPEKLQFLNKDLQAGFTRRLNLLNKGASTAVENIVAEAGLKIPEGKSALDLLTDNDGKDFFSLIRGQIAQEVKPLTELAATQKTSENIRSMVAVAIENFPEVKENVQEVVRVIDADPELTQLSKAYGGNALPYVMRGVAATINETKLKAEVKRLSGILDAAKVAKDAGKSTSRAGGTRPVGEEGPKGRGRLDWAISEGVKRMETEQ
jgi:hypothetical protein